MLENKEKIELSFEEMDLVYLALKERVESIAAIEKKAKTLQLGKTEKGAIGDGSKVAELLNKFLTPARKKLDETEEGEGEEEGE